MKKLFILCVRGLFYSVAVVSFLVVPANAGGYKNKQTPKIAGNSHYAGSNDQALIEFNMDIEGPGPVAPIKITSLKIDYTPKGKRGVPSPVS